MRFRPDEWFARLPGPPNELWPRGARSVSALSFGAHELKLYAPRGSDPQQPHARDEIYVVISGRGRFESAGMAQDFAAGDALFVAAGVPHRFAECSDDFATWVVFCGPEAASAAPAQKT
jgi:mannose-6-phosphate isomerase-like protein (cupin superfamily)